MRRLNPFARPYADVAARIGFSLIEARVGRHLRLTFEDDRTGAAAVLYTPKRLHGPRAVENFSALLKRTARRAGPIGRGMASLHAP